MAEGFSRNKFQLSCYGGLTGQSSRFPCTGIKLCSYNAPKGWLVGSWRRWVGSFWFAFLLPPKTTFDRLGLKVSCVIVVVPYLGKSSILFQPLYLHVHIYGN